MTDHDDELIEQLRRTLQAEAAAITPSPAGQRAQSYPTPIPLRRTLPRWPLTAAAAAVLAAAVTLAALNWPGGGSSRLGVVTTGPPTTHGSTAVPTTVAPLVVPPVTTLVRPPAATVPTATTVPPPPTPVAAGFAPLAVTFVSPAHGWTAGRVPCGSASCLALAQTFDGGHTWGAVPAPAVTLQSAVPGPTASVRFADRFDGWIYATNPTRLWSTHDGGVTWQQMQVAGLTPQSDITAMEAGGGYVRLAVIPVNATTIHVDSSPVASDAWTDTDTGVPVGAGPVPATQLVLQGTNGWLLENDRTVVGGARLDPSGRWLAWTPPCLTANGAATLAASTATELVAVCHEGDWGPPGNLPAGATFPSTWVFHSSDAGTSFQPVGPLPSGGNAGAVTSAPSAQAIVVAGYGGTALTVERLVGSFDGGKTWSVVFQGSEYSGWQDVGFTTDSQGVAIEVSAFGSFLLMTRDGGHHWAPVSW